MLGIPFRRSDAGVLLLSRHSKYHRNRVCRTGASGRVSVRRRSVRARTCAGGGDLHPPRAADGHIYGVAVGDLPGDVSPIHNANMLVSALLARLSKLLRRDDLGSAAAAALDYTICRQRSDGSWPYGEQPHLAWVDGFHTGYVRLCSHLCGVGLWWRGRENRMASWIALLREAIIERDGTPRYGPRSRYPVDGQSVAQAILTLSRAVPLEPKLGDRRWDVARYALVHLARGMARLRSSASAFGSTVSRIRVGSRLQCSRR